MEITLTPIGNSYGVRIPQAILKQCGITKTLTLSVKKKTIMLSPTAPRSTWHHAFNQTSSVDTPSSPVLDLPNEFDKKDWQW